MERDSKDVVQKPAPYLRSGKGTESRQQASQSSRRYIPKGGFVIDFTTQPLPKGKGRAAPNGCHTDVSREVLIARQQRAAARLSAPKHSAGNSPVTKKLELPDLEFPDHPKPWGAARCRAILKENIGPHLATSGHTKQMGYHERVRQKSVTKCTLTLISQASDSNLCCLCDMMSPVCMYLSLTMMIGCNSNRESVACTGTYTSKAQQPDSGDKGV